MIFGTEDQAEGKFHKIKGILREIAGQLSDDPKLEAEGTGEKIAGRQSSGKDRSDQPGPGEVVRAVYHAQACPWAPEGSCMIHRNHDSKRQESSE
jgi:uncharacterized protein YjbJ (UPF0337 family)